MCSTKMSDFLSVCNQDHVITHQEANEALMMLVLVNIREEKRREEKRREEKRREEKRREEKRREEKNHQT